MKRKFFLHGAAALLLSTHFLPSMAYTPRPDLLGTPAPVTAAERTVTIDPATRYVNVKNGEVVKFAVGNQAFAWHFDIGGSVNALSSDLNTVAPAGMLDHEVYVYVSPNPLYKGE